MDQGTFKKLVEDLVQFEVVVPFSVQITDHRAIST